MSTAHPSAPISGPDAPSAIEIFLDLHSRKLLVALAVVIALVAVFTALHLKKKKFEAQAGSSLVAAADIDSLRKVMADYAGTPAAETAVLFLAEKQLAAGDANGAAETLRAFLAKNAGHPLVSQARLALATALTRLGKTDEAGAEIATFLQETPTSPLAPLAMSMKAELAEKAGDTAAARKLYEETKASFPESTLGIMAESRAERVGFVMPTEIEPPPPAPAPPAAPAAPSIPPLLENNAPLPIPGTAAPSAIPAEAASPAPAAPPAPGTP